MSNSKHLPPFTFEVLCYLNRDRLERFSIICRSLKNLVERYFHSKPYRVFDELYIHGGSYSLLYNWVRWHPKRDDYSVQQFLAGRKCSIDESKLARDDYTYYSFSDMRPYLGPTVRINWTIIYVSGASAYNAEHVVEMEFVTYTYGAMAKLAYCTPMIRLGTMLSELLPKTSSLFSIRRQSCNVENCI